MTVKYPENVKKIAKILRLEGASAYAVGGCIRDSIMGRVPNDWDVTTDLSPDGMLSAFGRAGLRTVPTGLAHGTVTVLFDGEAYECTTFRIDGEYTDSRRPDSVSFTSELSEDLARRDFTVNAIAGDPLSENGELYDPFGGASDIALRTVRCVGDPEKRFSEDALRILRAVRFATVLDFEIDPPTYLAAKKLGDRLSAISAERRAAELEKILLSPHADRGVALLLELDLAKYIHPDIRNPKIALSALPESFACRLAALFDRVPSLERMKLSGAVSREVALLCNDGIFEECTAVLRDGSNRSELGLDETAAERAAARIMLSRYGSSAASAALLRGETALADTVRDEAEKNPDVRISDLKISGNDLIALGIPPRNIGGIMQKLLHRVLLFPECNSREELLRLAKEDEN